MADVWNVVAKTSAIDMYNDKFSINGDMFKVNELTNICNQMSNSYEQFIEDQNDYETEIDTQLDEIESLKKELDKKIKEQDAEKQKILAAAGNEGLTDEDEAKIKVIDNEIETLNSDTNIKIRSVGAKVEDISTKESLSKAEIATDYAETTIEKGTPLANMKDKRKSFWRKLSGSWNKAAQRKAGNDAIDAGNNLLEKVATASKNEATIIKKTKVVKQ